jgi:UDP:flavonoid glycosyltransferase YjiC (YdhE family)
MSIGRQKYALFVSVPLVGHMNPLLRQAEELARRGYDVALAST